MIYDKAVKTKVLFLCTGNSCRSQMAEGFGRTLGEGTIEAFSAGFMPAGVNPYAIRVMAEVGVDIKGQSSKSATMKTMEGMDIIITLCDNAAAFCPATPPGIKRLHWPINDPVGTVGTDEEIMAAFRVARDEIRGKVEKFIEGLR